MFHTNEQREKKKVAIQRVPLRLTASFFSLSDNQHFKLAKEISEYTLKRCHFSLFFFQFCFVVVFFSGTDNTRTITITS